MSTPANAKRKREEDAAAPTNKDHVLAKAVGELKAYVSQPPTQRPLIPKPVPASVQPPQKKAATTAAVSKSLIPPAAAKLSFPNPSAWSPNKSAYNNNIPKASKSAPKPILKTEPKEGATFIDEVINEANDLLQAAREAQCLGRLRASSSYLLLAHARLVGLGRRFDRSRCLEDETPAEQPAGENSNSNATILQPPQADAKSIILPPLPVAHNALPEVSLMEHLARSGMELHHKRTGRGMQHEAQMEKMASVPSKGKAASVASDAEKEDDTPTKRKGGRGKKPPTLVMHTLLGAELDAKNLMNINPNV